MRRTDTFADIDAGHRFHPPDDPAGHWERGTIDETWDEPHEHR